MIDLRARRQLGRVLVLGFLLVLLAGVCGREAWGYYEARQFNRMVEAVVGRNEPTSLFQVVQRPDWRGVGVVQPNAAQHYLAAGELVVTRLGWFSGYMALLAVAGDGALGDVDDRRDNADFVQENADVIHLIERATDLDFLGFRTSIRNRPTRFSRLHELVGAAALERIDQGDGDGSLRGVADLLAMRRASDPTDVFAIQLERRTFDQAALLTSLTIRHAPPSADALRALAAALATPERDLLSYFLADRAWVINEVWQHVRARRRLSDANPVVTFLLEPWHLYRANRLLARLTALCAAAEQPWPERLAAIAAVEDGAPEAAERTGPQRLLWRERLFTVGHYSQLGWAVANRLAMTTALRAVIAIELYRMERGAVPERLTDLGRVSPFSDLMTGDPLLYRRESDGYVAYSVGSNGDDDDGDLGPRHPFLFAIGHQAPEFVPDWGIRIRLPETEAP